MNNDINKDLSSEIKKEIDTLNKLLAEIKPRENENIQINAVLGSLTDNLSKLLASIVIIREDILLNREITEQHLTSLRNARTRLGANRPNSVDQSYYEALLDEVRNLNHAIKSLRETFFQKILHKIVEHFVLIGITVLITFIGSIIIGVIPVAQTSEGSQTDCTLCITATAIEMPTRSSQPQTPVDTALPPHQELGLLPNNYHDTVELPNETGNSRTWSISIPENGWNLLRIVIPIDFSPVIKPQDDNEYQEFGLPDSNGITTTYR